MRGRKLFELILVLLISQVCLANNQQQKNYKNTEINILFSYPDTWFLDDPFFPKSTIISLYSPKALKTTDSTYELIQGVKIEIYVEEEENSKDPKDKSCNLLKKNGKSLKQFCTKIDDCLIIITYLKMQDENFSIVAYLPEKGNRKQHWMEYNKLILSFSQLKNDSSQ